MAWQQQSKYHISNGNYTVSVSYTQGTPVFSAWPPKPPYSRTAHWSAVVHNVIGCYATADAAKRACMAHAATRALCSYLYQLNNNATETGP